MRPVRLEMHGFAAFREPTVVDFAGADYFALVGPTGSGKSTVIDALTFALYGTVPRWDDRRAVALGLAPSVTRGVVRLVFEARDARYVAVRELRRTARGGVNVRNARLERLVDPDDVDGPTEVLAADSGVTKAVEELLGLSFEHFTSCVVLPQGEFAEFLHAKPADRQAILTRLLGLGVYERIAREANREASTQGDRAALLAEQLGAYADVTDEAAAAADERVAALEVLSATVAALVPEAAAAASAVADAEAAVASLESERARLDALAVPDGLAALDDRRRAAEQQADDARRRFADAEAADDAARKLVADAPARAPLERARRDHTDLATVVTARPAAAAAHTATREAEERAARQVRAAEEAATAAAAARDLAASAHATARTAAERLADERARLAGVQAPAGLAAATRRRAEAVATLDAAEARLAEADAMDSAVRARLAAAPPRRPLEQARRDLAALAAAVAAEPDLVAQHLAAAQTSRDAAQRVARARAALAETTRRRDEAVRGDLAAALRPALVVGEECPVCAQEVSVLPPPSPGADPGTLDAVVAHAQAGVEAALAAEAAAVADERQAANERDRAAAEVARLRDALADLGFAGSESVDAELAALDRLTAQAADADATTRRARRARDEAAAGVEAVRGELAAAAEALHAARDPLVPLGAPATAVDDPAAGWDALVRWATAQVVERDAALSAAREAAARTGEESAVAARRAEAAAGEASARRREETAAARAEQQARGRVEALDERAAVLQLALAEAPSADRVEEELARLDALEAAGRSADAELRAARTARAAADDALGAVRADITAGWEALRAARDPLVPLGAPSVAGDDLVAAWAGLLSWAAAESAVRAARSAEAAAGATAARSAREAAVGRLIAVLDGAGVGAASSADVPGSAEAAVAAALTGARGARDRLAERRAEAAAKRAELARAEEAQQVARMLGGLLRSDRFPRWLVASALDALVADASAGLAELSGGQFELTHDEGEFLVVDHADADARRPVKTLSGGETFQASLALALALSAQMSSLAAEGAARLDSIFLDEGFGTLDEANLDVVAGTLENLAGRGDRMVGVITHVPGLAERVPVRFAVRRDQRSARIEREAG
jgi:DNA repair protein SbcC/Rad50